MKKYILVGLLVIIVLGIALAPATLISRALDGQPQLSLLQPRGTVWQGQGQLLVQGHNVGSLSWSLNPLSLFTLSIQADWQLDQVLARVTGQASVSSDLFDLRANGTVQAGALAPVLGVYDIDLTGVFELTNVHLTGPLDGTTLNSADGQVDWSGGPVRFGLSGRLFEQTLPPLVAFLKDDPAPHASVFAQGDETPLMHLGEGAPGFIKIDVTKRFTTLIGQPWPGNDPGHRVVVSVEEQIL